MTSGIANKTLSTIAVVMLFVSMCTAGDRKVNLRGNWKFSLGDNMNFAKQNYDDSKWESMYVPAAWQEEGFREYRGYAWYRFTFEISYKANEPLFIELGRIDDVDEVYINGHLVGSTGGFPPGYYTAYNVNRAYLIPTEFLQQGKGNVVAVRVFDEGGEGGILGRNPGIFSYSDVFANGFVLMGNWKFQLSDDPAWSKPDFDDSKWESIAVPASWEDQGFRDYDGFAWYRKTFTLPKDFPANEMVLLLGRIDDMDEAFLNGTMIGSTGNMDRKWANNDEHNSSRTYFIPEGLLKPGATNTIAVRVYDQESRGGIYDGPVTIIKRSEYRTFWKKYKEEDFSWWSILGWDDH
ncbi:MAG TPA: beta galactosidase jelly roll domain-containing protein [Cyclobacteriaceae bacterium]|nr:beta galactosidase jelly roll domain-containing protein [Cyclobacteriaceae bacterium]